MCSNEEGTFPSMQRRANARFTFSPLYPLFCFARNPLDGRVTPLRATDASNGGISLCGPPSEQIPLIGLEIPCQFDAPAIGSFSTTLVFRNVDRPSEGASFRVSAEFLALSAHARDIIGSCLTRPMSSNSIRELRRERLLPRFWPDLVDFSAVPNEKCAHADLKLVGRLADEVVCTYTVNRQRDGSECVVSCGPATSELDTADLRAAALKAVTLQRRSIGASSVSLREADLSQASYIASSSLATLSPEAYQRSTDTGHQNGDRAVTRRTRADARKEVRWDEYAEAYDVMCSANPAYAENLDIFNTWISRLGLPRDAKVCDVGAGTGNYVLEVATRFPESNVIHLDSDPMMNKAASRKYRARGATNVAFATSDARSATFPAACFDLIVCVNALYTFDSAERALERFHVWLKPTGYLFLIDLGRPMDVTDWSRYIVASSVKRVGFVETARAFLKGRKAIGQNRLIRREQQHGHYWLHTSDQFAMALQRSGFDIAHAGTCYRDVCDLAVCKKTTS